MQPFDKLYYFADPMCSWCYGFGPAVAAFAAQHADLPITPVMGGLRPYTAHALPTKQAQEIRTHWHHVEEASGLPFDDALLMKPGFIYDTEPACRAVVVVRAMVGADALAYLKSVQDAFYRDARDVTDADVLAAIAQECGLDHAQFAASLPTDAMREAVRADFALTQSVGIRGFPALCAARGNELFMIASGFTTAESLAQQFQQLSQTARQQ